MFSKAVMSHWLHVKEWDKVHTNKKQLSKGNVWITEGFPVAQTVKRLPAKRETWVQFLGWEDPLEKEMATHSSTLAWKIPWTEEPGRPQSMGSQRVRHDWVTSLSLSFSSCGEQGLLSSCAAWPSHCSGHSCCGLQCCSSQAPEHRLSSCGTWASPMEKERATHIIILAWEIPKDRGAYWATVHRVPKSDTT